MTTGHACALEPTILTSLPALAIVSQHAGLMQMFTMPDGYRCTKKDEDFNQFQEEALEAARPAPAPAEPPAKQKQLSVSSFLAANNNRH